MLRRPLQCNTGAQEDCHLKCLRRQNQLRYARFLDIGALGGKIEQFSGGPARDRIVAVLMPGVLIVLLCIHCSHPVNILFAGCERIQGPYRRDTLSQKKIPGYLLIRISEIKISKCRISECRISPCRINK